VIVAAGAAPWDTEWAAEKATEALRYLGRNSPECLENLRVLDEHETAAHEAAMRGDRDAYLEALRRYMRAGRDEALRIRRGRREVNICQQARPGPAPPGAVRGQGGPGPEPLKANRTANPRRANMPFQKHPHNGTADAA